MVFIGGINVLIRELLASIEALGLDPETELVISHPISGCYTEFEVVICDYEHEGGSVISGPDSGGWGGRAHDPRPLPRPVISLDLISSEYRKPITF
jgi:hypothetical protein